MNSRELTQLRVFSTVARLRSFAGAARELGTSRPAVSRSISELEERIGARLLNRTTRSVATTVAGTRLLEQVGPAFAAMEAALFSAGAVAGELGGHLRINASSLAARECLAPILPKFLRKYPSISVEVASDDKLVDMVAGGFDAGIRLGEALERDMVAVPVGPELRMRIVAAPSYLKELGLHAYQRICRAIAVSICAFQRQAAHTDGN